MYQPRQGSSRPLSQQDLDAHFAALPGAQASAGGTLAAKQLDRDWAGLRKVYGDPPEAPRVAAPKPDGSKMKLAEQWAAEFRLQGVAAAARQAHGGGVFQASTHKLPTYVIGGRS